MAWSIPTYSGYKMTGGSPNGYRTAIFELCRAVNEREDAVNLSKTDFIKADLTEDSDLTIDDFEGMFTTGLFTVGAFTVQPYCENLKRVQSAIKTMLTSGRFTESSGRSDALTKATVEAAIGTDLDTDPTKANDARFLQAQQDALDLMIYGKHTVTPALPGTTVTTPADYANGTSAGGTPRVDMNQSAWDDLISSPSSPPGSPLDVNILWWRVSNGGGLSSVTASRRNFCEGIGLTSEGSYVGDVQAVDYSCSMTSQKYTGSGFNVTIGSATDDVGASGTEILEASSVDFTLGDSDTVSLQINSSLPSTVPFSTLSGSNINDFAEIKLTLSEIHLYVDLEAELTDQA